MGIVGRKVERTKTLCQGARVSEPCTQWLSAEETEEQSGRQGSQRGGTAKTRRMILCEVSGRHTCQLLSRGQEGKARGVSVSPTGNGLQVLWEVGAGECSLAIKVCQFIQKRRGRSTIQREPKSRTSLFFCLHGTIMKLLLFSVFL